MELIKKTEQEILVLQEHKIDNTNTMIPLLHYPLLENLDMVEHCFSTRLGGVSSGIYESMNFSFVRGDEPEAVHENYRRLSATMHTTPDCIVTTDQTHTTNIRKVGKADCGKGIIYPRDYTDIDGLITDEPGVMLSTFYADCVP